MAVTLTYEPVLSRVRITATGLAAADVALVERSTDQVRWTTVRGGGAVGVTAGVFDLTLDDYEFAPDVVNYYRVRGYHSAVSLIAAGTSSHADNTSVVPALPAGFVAGDVILIEAAIWNSGTGTPDTPAGYTLLANAANLRLYGKVHSGSESAPTVSFTGGVAGATTSAQASGLRGVDLSVAAAVAQLNGSAVTIATPALAVPVDDVTVLYGAWRADDWGSGGTDVTPLPGFVEIGEPRTTTGNDQGITWGYQTQTAATDIPAGVVTPGAGGPAISRSFLVGLTRQAFLNEQSSSTTPLLAAGCGNSAVWLKSIARPFLNQTAQVVNQSSITMTRPARVAIFDIVGRSFPIAVSDVRGSRRWTMFVRTETAAEASTLDFLLASGDVIFIQTPADCASVPSGYVAVGDTARTSHPLRPLRVTWTLPLTEVAPPGPDVVGAAVTWSTVLATWATWTDVIASNPSWLDLLAGTASPSEVIVP